MLNHRDSKNSESKGGNTFGSWLRERRRELDLTQDELGELVACSGDAIRKIELGDRRPSKQVAELLVEALKVPSTEAANFVRLARASGTGAYITLLPSALGSQEKKPQSTPNNLPAPVTRFIGRQRELELLRNRLTQDEVRLLTLTGPPGVGKTRLSLEVVRDLLPLFEDGVFFTKLASLNAVDLVVPTIASALGLRESQSQDPLETLKTFLKDRQLLLILDNFEHLLPAATLITMLLEGCPRLKVLTTSREPLQLYPEHRFQVAPLDLPSATGLDYLGLEALARYSAIELFVSRASAVRFDFTISEHNAADIVGICRRLDCLPLTIELAAARSDCLEPQEMLNDLQSRMELLKSGGRDLHVRHQTLRAALEWSYDLLEEHEKRLLERLAVFQGGMALRHIEAVCNADRAPQSEFQRRVEALVNKSLLQQRDTMGAEIRFTMLETIHEFAWAKLNENRGTDGFRRRHAEVFTAYAEQISPEATGSDRVSWFEHLESEHDNLRAAFTWALETGDLETGLRLAVALGEFWYVRGYLTEGRQRLADILSMARRKWEEERKSPSANATSKAEPGPMYAKALEWASRLAWAQGDFTSSRHLAEQSLTIFRELNDKRGMAQSLNRLGSVAGFQSDFQRAGILFEEALQLYRELGDRDAIADASIQVGCALNDQEDPERARLMMEEGLMLHRESGNKGGIGFALENLGEVAYQQCDFTAAHSAWEEGLSLFRHVGDKRRIAIQLCYLGYLEQRRANCEIAAKYLKESIGICKEIGDVHDIAMCLSGFAGLSLCRKEEQPKHNAQRAVRLLAAVDRILKSLDAGFWYVDRTEYEWNQEIAYARLDTGEWSVAWAEGQAMSLEQVVEYALAEA